MGSLNKHGISPAGSGVEVPIIAPTQVPAGITAFITEFGASQETPGAQGVFKLQKSTDNFASNIVEVERMLAVGVEKIHLTLDSGFKIDALSWFRVLFVQGTPGPATATLSGETYSATGGPSPDIMD